MFDDSVRPELHAELARRLESSTATSGYQLADLAARDYVAACEACGVYAMPAGDLVLGVLSPEERAWLVRGRG